MSTAPLATAHAVSPRSQPWWWTGSLVLLAIAMGVYLLAPTEADPDLWGHVRFGLDLFDTGHIVRADVYSYLTRDRAWINHEWLSEAIMAMAFRAAGAAGLVVVKMAIGLAVAALLVWHLRTREYAGTSVGMSADANASASGSGSEDGARGISLLAALLMTAYGLAVMLPGFRSLRPQAFTYLAFLLMLLLLHRAGRGHQRWLWLAPPLVAVWANLHGGFVAGLGVMLVWLVVSLMTTRETRDAPGRGRGRGRAAVAIVAPVAVAIGATLVNPYGVELSRFLARTLGPRPEIAEWQAVPLASAEGVAYLAVLLFGAVGVWQLWRGLSSNDARGRRWTATVLFMCGAMLPFVARRHLPLFVLITLVFCAEHTAAAIGGFVRRRWPGEAGASSDRFRPIVAMAMVLQAMVLIAIAAPQVARVRVDAAEYPVAATAWLARSGVAANLAVDFDWGEYVLWHAGPRVKVSVDGRRETVYSDAAYEENMQFADGVGEWDRLLTRHPTDLALVRVRTPVFSLLAERADWELLMQDDTSASALFGRRDAAATAAVRATPVPVINPRLASLFP